MSGFCLHLREMLHEGNRQEVRIKVKRVRLGSGQEVKSILFHPLYLQILIPYRAEVTYECMYFYH